MFLNTKDLRNQEVYLELYKTTDENKEKGYVPAYYFNIIRCIDDIEVGKCDLRIGHNDNIKYGGNIGYEVYEYPFIIYDKNTDKPIGTCSLGTEGPEGCWGFGFDIIKELWGNGYATEVAKEMIDFAYSFGVRDLHCTVATENIASCRVMEKCGLKADTTSSFKNHKTDVEHKSIIYKMRLE